MKKTIVFLVICVLMFVIAAYIKHYRLDLLQNGIVLSEGATCKLHCFENSIISVSQISFAVLLFIWAGIIDKWQNEKVSNRMLIKKLFPPKVLRIAGFFFILQFPIVLYFSCFCSAIISSLLGR